MTAPSTTESSRNHDNGIINNKIFTLQNLTTSVKTDTDHSEEDVYIAKSIDSTDVAVHCASSDNVKLS